MTVSRDTVKRVSNYLNSVDWSGSSDDYKLCVSALKEEVLDVVNQMEYVVNSKKITKANFKEWPVFDFIRENEEFCTKYLQIFGGSIREGEKAKAVEIQVSASTNSLNKDTTTVH